MDPLTLSLDSRVGFRENCTVITQREIYLDCNATHPLLPSVREGLAKSLLEDGAELSNPSSIHRRGQKAKKALVGLKERLCQFLGRGEPEEFILTSGATESINALLRGFVVERAGEGKESTLIANTMEHSSVIDTLADAEIKANKIVLPVDRHGQLDADRLESEIAAQFEQKRSPLLTLQLCNNETGSAFDLDAILPRLRARFGYDLTILLDAAQALGKLPDDHVRRALHWADAMAVSGHKVGAPSGVGALWVRPKTPYRSLITGGTQERRRRAGTHNMLGALGFDLALQDWFKNGAQYREKMAFLRSKMAAAMAAIPGVEIHALQVSGALPLLPNTLNFHAEGSPEESLVLALDLDGFCVSSGSACNSGTLKPSRVLIALGYPTEVALSSVRATVGATTTEAEVDAFCQSLPLKIERIRGSRKLSEELLPRIN